MTYKSNPEALSDAIFSVIASMTVGGLFRNLHSSEPVGAFRRMACSAIAGFLLT